ncbi:unnamed protein product [Amoebophrya sp. A120]|nr:unnamed protein product [Amoebophrya sp. A120]|eukprot:GSA120T00013928001.1
MVRASSLVLVLQALSLQQEVQNVLGLRLQMGPSSSPLLVVDENGDLHPPTGASSSSGGTTPPAAVAVTNHTPPPAEASGSLADGPSAAASSARRKSLPPSMPVIREDGSFHVPAPGSFHAPAPASAPPQMSMEAGPSRCRQCLQGCRSRCCACLQSPKIAVGAAHVGCGGLVAGAFLTGTAQASAVVTGTACCCIAGAHGTCVRHCGNHDRR